MFYLGADNNLEYDIVRNVEQIKESYQGGCNVIIFIDRSSKYSINSKVFGENFSGGRIYRVLKNNDFQLLDKGEVFSEIEGFSENSIDSSNIFVLKKFIEYCKSNYPSKHYGLIVGSHGGGSRKIDTLLNKNIVYDEPNDNWIYTALFTEVLDSSHSVDVLGLDACFMGNLEFLYQIRYGNNSFNAKYVLASPPTEWSQGWNYRAIFGRISDYLYDTDGYSGLTKDKKLIYSNSTLKPYDLAKIIIEEHYDYTHIETDDQVLAMYDTENITTLKNSFDSLMVSLKDNSSDLFSLRGNGLLSQNDILYYFDSSVTSEWIDYPYFDMYDFTDRIANSTIFSQDIITKANLVKDNLDKVIIYSFAGSYFKRFRENVSGLSFFFTDGNRIYKNKNIWSYQTFYNAKSDQDSYGKLAFCIDNAVENNKIIENYFEVLDYWFDVDDGNGGYNGYSY